MKQTIYVFLLALSWVVIVLILATLLIAFGLSSMPPTYGFAAQLGGTCANMQLWFIALGVSLFLRPIAYELAFKEKKEFKKGTATASLVFGLLWLIFVTTIRVLTSETKQQAIEEFQKMRNDK